MKAANVKQKLCLPRLCRTFEPEIRIVNFEWKGKINLQKGRGILPMVRGSFSFIAGGTQMDAG